MIHSALSNYSLIKREEGSDDILSTDVFIADSIFKKAIGLMFTSQISERTALIFPYNSVEHRRLHMCCVPYQLGVIYITNNTVQSMDVMDPWTGSSSCDAEVVIEIHPTVLDDISVGDTLYLGSSSGENISIASL